MSHPRSHPSEATEPPGDVVLRNLTAWRLAVAGRLDVPALIIPPFGQRVLRRDQVAQYAWQEWSAQRLVVLEEVRGPEGGPATRIDLSSRVSGYSFLLALALGVVWLVHGRVGWLYAGAAALVATFWFAYRAGWHGDVWRLMARSAHLFSIAVVTVGSTFMAVLFVTDFWGDTAAHDLALIVVWLFIAVASVLPAGLFFFFHRQKVPTLRANFLRDVVRLDPNVQTVEDAENAYDELLGDVYGSGSTGAAPGGRIPVLVATLLITALWVWALVPGLADETAVRSEEAAFEDLPLIFLPERDVVTFAFLGAYVFAVNMLFRRYTRADLGPKAYTHIAVRILAAVATTWVVSFAPFASGADGEPRSLLLLLAFMVGIVPETGIAVIQDLLQQWRPVGRAIPSLAEEHPLSRLNGISLYDRTHLLEVGIENVESLAHHPLVDLMLWTRIPTPRLVDFVDQAILYLHTRGPVGGDDDDDGSRMLLCRHGIRTASDLERVYAVAAARSREEGDALLALLDPPGARVSRLRLMLDAMADDEWMVYVRNWREQSSAAAPIRSVEEFVTMSARRAGAGRPVPAPAPATGAAGGPAGTVVDLVTSPAR